MYFINWESWEKIKKIIEDAMLLKIFQNELTKIKIEKVESRKTLKISPKEKQEVEEQEAEKKAAEKKAEEEEEKKPKKEESSFTKWLVGGILGIVFLIVSIIIYFDIDSEKEKKK